MSAIDTVSSLIEDPRERGGISTEQDDVKVLHDAPKISGKARTVLHTVIAHHMNHDCVEICCVHVRLNIEAPRIYVNYGRLQNTIDPQVYNERVAALKDEITQQRREYKPQKVRQRVSNDLMLEYLMWRLHLSDDCSEAEGVFIMDLRLVAGDPSKVIPHPDNFDMKLAVHDIICEKPRELQPVRLDSTAKTSNPSRCDPAMQAADFNTRDERRRHERRRSEFSCLLDLSLDDLRNSLSLQYKELHSEAWLRWKRATGRVMLREVQLPKMQKRVEASCAAEWYYTALAVRAENVERAERRRRLEERIDAIAAAEVPDKVDRQRLCYTMHSEEVEKKKGESIAKLGNGVVSLIDKDSAFRPLASGSRRVSSSGDDVGKKKRRPSLTTANSADVGELKKSPASAAAATAAAAGAAGGSTLTPSSAAKGVTAKRRPSLTSLNSTGYSGSGGGYTPKSGLASGNERRGSHRSVGSGASGLDSDSEEDTEGVLRLRSISHSNQTTPRVEGRKLPPLDPSLSPRLSPVHSPLPSTRARGGSCAGIGDLGEPVTTSRRLSIEVDLQKTAQQLQRRDKKRNGSLTPSAARDSKLPALSTSNDVHKIFSGGKAAAAAAAVAGGGGGSSSCGGGTSDAQRRHSYSGQPVSFETQLKAFQEQWEHQERQYSDAQQLHQQKKGERLKQRRSFVLMNEYEKTKTADVIGGGAGGGVDQAPPSLKDTFGIHAKKLDAHVPLEAFTDPYTKGLHHSASAVDGASANDSHPRRHRHRNQLQYSHGKSVDSRSSTIGSCDAQPGPPVDLSHDHIASLKLPVPLFSPSPVSESVQHGEPGFFTFHEADACHSPTREADDEASEDAQSVHDIYARTS